MYCWCVLCCCQGLIFWQTIETNLDSLFGILEFLRNELLYSSFPCFWKDYSNKYLWWGFSCLYSLMYPFFFSFFSPNTSLLILRNNPTQCSKALGDDRKAPIIPLPQTMTSMTQSRALLQTNAPNLPQLYTAHSLSPEPELSLWSPCITAAKTRRKTSQKEKLWTTGPTTVQRLHGKETWLHFSASGSGTIV